MKYLGRGQATAEVFQASSERAHMRSSKFGRSETASAAGLDAWQGGVSVVKVSVALGCRRASMTFFMFAQSSQV